jgi:hypothetical protein
MRKKLVIRRWKYRSDLEAKRLQVCRPLFVSRLSKRLDTRFYQGEWVHWCPLCTAEMFEGYGSFSIYSQIVEKWETIQNYDEAMQKREDEALNQGKELEEEWLNPFADAPDEPGDNEDIVLFFFCSNCDLITPASGYDDAVRNYSDWHDVD